MKKTKRLIAMMLSFAMILGCTPGLFSMSYAVEESWTFEIYAEDKKMVPEDEFYENNNYRVLTYCNGTLNKTYDNCTYPRVSDPDYESANYLAFGPFEITNASDIKLENKHFTFRNSITQNDVKSFYNGNKDVFGGYESYKVQDTNNYYFVIPKSVSPAVFVVCKNEGQVFQDKFSVTPGDTINLACIPKIGWTLDKYYWYDKEGNTGDITGSTFTVPDNLTNSIFLDAKYNETLGRNLDLSYRYKTIERVAELLNMDDQEKLKFVDYIITLPDHYEYLNSTKFMYDLIRPLYKELYSAPYENETQEVDSIKEYLEDISSLTPTKGYENTSSAKVSYAKRTVGLLMLSYYSMFDEASDANKCAISENVMFDDFKSIITKCNDSSTNQMINESFVKLFTDAISSMTKIADIEGAKIETAEETYRRPSPIKYLIDELDAENVWLNWSDNYYKNDLERYQLYIKNFFKCMEPDITNTSISQEDRQKYSELERIIDEEVFKWAATKFEYGFIKQDLNDDNKFFYRDSLVENISNMENALESIQEETEKNALKFEIIKEQIRLITRELCEDKALMEALLFEGDWDKVCSVFEYDTNYRSNIADLMGEIQGIKNNAEVILTERVYESIYNSDLYDKFIASDSNASKVFLIAALKDENNNDVSGYYDTLREEMQNTAREQKIVIEEVDGLYEYDELGDVDYNVYFEKDGVKTRIPTYIEKVYKDPELEEEVQNFNNIRITSGVSDYFYKIKIDYGQMSNLFVNAIPDMNELVYFEIDNETGRTFNKYYRVDNTYPDDVIWYGEDSFIIDVKPRNSMKIDIDKVPELKYGDNVSKVVNCNLNGKKVTLYFSNFDGKLKNPVELPYTIEAYKNSINEGNKITDEELSVDNKYFLKTSIDITDLNSNEIFTAKKLGDDINNFGDAIDELDFDVVDIGIYINDNDTEETYVYQYKVDDNIISVDVNEQDNKIYVYSYLPILKEPEITDFSYVSNTSDTITFRVKGNDLAHSYELNVVKKDNTPSGLSMGDLSSSINLEKLSWDYKSFENDALIRVEDVIPGKEQLLIFPLTNYVKRKLGINSFASGDYYVAYNAPIVTNDAHSSEIPASISDFDFVDFRIGGSSSKKYKAVDNDKTVENISGTGKKGSKRIVTPIEGKKAIDVIVKDKNGNRVDVTKNEDGTYTFIQPASDVTVEVVYKNREITLTIGSTNADVDGEKSNLDVAPKVVNDRTMLPIRFVAENLGAKVEWDEKHPELVVITKGDIKIEITLGSDIAKVNGKEFTLDSVAFAENDRTYLPVRFVSEHLNAIVEWNESKPMEVKIYER